MREFFVYQRLNSTYGYRYNGGRKRRKVCVYTMNFKGIEKKEAGKFITRYDITYETVDNQKKVYEIISRKKDMETYEA